MQNNDQQQNDLWIKQSLGAASNWEELDEADRVSLRKAAAWYAIIAIGLAIGVGILSFTILQDGAKATLVTSSLAIIGAVFPAIEKSCRDRWDTLNQQTRNFMLQNLN